MNDSMLQLSQQFPEVFEHSGLSHGQKGKRMEVALAYAKNYFLDKKKKKFPRISNERETCSSQAPVRVLSNESPLSMTSFIQ